MESANERYGQHDMASVSASVDMSDLGLVKTSLCVYKVV